MAENRKWDLRFLELAEHVSGWSKDPNTKVGAVIVDHKRRVVSMGYNGFPIGVEDTPERLNDRDTKHLFVCHAERNALDNSPGSVESFTLYSQLLPCSECAKSIIQRGIRSVVTYAPTREDTFNWDITRKLLYESGLTLVEYQLIRI